MQEYLENHKDRFIEELKEILRIPSVSADSKYKEDVLAMAEMTRQSLIDAGVDMAELCETPGYPIVYGEKIIDSSKPTVLVYGHYDVQPADPIDLWNSPPFEPVIKDGKIVARGSADDKGQFYMHVKAFEMMMKTDTLPCNVKFMIEGEEEIGSNGLGWFVPRNKEKLKADVVLISDTSLIANDVPSITTGLRGLSYLEVELTGPKRDLHSGVYGGAVANPINVLCDMISNLIDDDGHITIPGFYEDVIDLSAEEREEMNKAPFSLDEYKSELDIDAVKGETGYTTLERASVRPTLDVNGIWGGYIGEGAKTVLPARAFAKISMRLVPDQGSEKITKLFKEHFENVAPDFVKVKVQPYHGGEPVVTSIDSHAYKSASRAMEATFGKKPIPTRGGGSIPIVRLFKDELGLDSILMGFGLDSDDIHSPNESYGIFNYLKGIETIPYFFKYFSEK